MSGLSDKIRCTLCLEELVYTKEPRELPCHHVYCTPCLESIQVSKDSELGITCAICRQNHHVRQIASLPNASLSSNETDANSTSSNGEINRMKCDKCRHQESDAVCYCVDCGKRLCHKHEKAHQDFFDDDSAHQVMSIQKYEVRPNYYKRRHCDTHQNEYYAVCCKNCFTLACSKCEDQKGCTRDPGMIQNVKFFGRCMRCQCQFKVSSGDGCSCLHTRSDHMPLGKCTGDGCNICEGFIPCKDIPQCSNCGHKPASHENEMTGEHSFVTIAHAALKLKAEFETLDKKCSDKLTRMCSLEKETWFDLDEMEQECGKLLEQVEKKAERLINKVNCELDRVRSMINDRLETEKTKVEKFLVELREERHRVESVRDEHCFFVQNNNIVEIINKRDERMDQLKRAAAPHPSELKMEEKTLLTDSLTSFLELEITLLPACLRYISSTDTQSVCRSPCFSDTGELHIICRNEIRSYQNKGCELSSKLDAGYVNCIVRSAENTDKDYYFVKHSTDNKRQRIVGKTADFITWEIMFEYEFDGIRAAKLAVSERFIVFDSQTSLMAFDRRWHNLILLHPDLSPSGLCFDKSGRLLVSDRSGLKKCEINETGMSTIWECKLSYAGAITITRHGVIVVRSHYEMIYIISAQG